MEVTIVDAHINYVHSLPERGHIRGSQGSGRSQSQRGCLTYTFLLEMRRFQAT